MNIPYVMKRCSKCGRWLVASKVNFNKSKKGKYRLQGYCRECSKNQLKQYNEDNKERIAEQNKQWREDNPEYQNQWNRDNKDKRAKYNKQYYEANKDKKAEHYKQWCEDNKEKMVEYQKQYREDNKDKIAERKKQYYQSPQGRVVAFNGCQRRRIKEEQQGTGITKEQWLEMMKYFDWKCAYSGETLTKDTRSIDHIVPLNSGGDNMIWNCVPMLRSLNSSKKDKDMLEWYKGQECYSEARLEKIYKWQEYARKKWKK